MYSSQGQGSEPARAPPDGQTVRPLAPIRRWGSSPGGSPWRWGSTRPTCLHERVGAVGGGSVSAECFGIYAGRIAFPGISTTEIARTDGVAGAVGRAGAGELGDGLRRARVAGVEPRHGWGAGGGPVQAVGARVAGPEAAHAVQPGPGGLAVHHCRGRARDATRSGMDRE